MESFDLHHLQRRRAPGKPERLLRAAVTAFGALTRPSRREIAQLDDLARPLVPMSCDETLRFVAAALCDLPHAPPGLIRRLAQEPVHISAPILMRSPVLTDVDLVALIGRHGGAHARAIAARTTLDPRVATLVRTIDQGDDQPVRDEEKGTAEAARQRLRAMMKPTPEATALRWGADPGPARKLRSAALGGSSGAVAAALATALAIPASTAADIVDCGDPAEFIVAMRALSLTPEEAFVVAFCVRPGRFGNARSASAFLEACEAIAPDAARRAAQEWQAPVAAMHPRLA